MLGGIQVGQNFSPVESGKVLKHSGQYNDDFGFSWTAVLAERQFGQVGSGGGDFDTGSLSMYLIQRFSALLKLCAIVRRVLLLSGSGAVAYVFCTHFRRWITSDDFISILYTPSF